ncbi:MAG: hypothetical protein Q8R28_19885, partial [Dehalococcoidia bacterium]|nr:hypothetical protein [Dehalococcoidia bacterium]
MGRLSAGRLPSPLGTMTPAHPHAPPREVSLEFLPRPVQFGHPPSGLFGRHALLGVRMVNLRQRAVGCADYRTLRLWGDAKDFK